jgi:hypothetical protein
MLLQVGDHVLERGRAIEKDGGAASQCLVEMQTDDIIGPTEQPAYGAIDIGNAPSRIVKDYSVGNGAHDIFSLARLPPGVSCVAIDAQEETRILDSQPDLLRELLQ